MDATIKRTRRSFSREFKAELVALTLEPDASVAQIAMDHQINANQLRRWINEAQLEPAVQSMVPVSMTLTSPSSIAASPVTAEIVTAHATLRILGNWDPVSVAALLTALR